METWPQFIDTMSIDTNTEQVSQAVIRGTLPADTAQRRISHRDIATKSATVILKKIQLPIFRYWLAVKCRSGLDWFRGPIADETGERYVTMRIVGGNYRVQFDGLIATLTFTVEYYL